MEFNAVRVSPEELRAHLRLIGAMKQRANWLQLIRFGVVGSSGFVLNLAIYAVCVHVVGIDYGVAAVLSWVLSAGSNFFFNRHWTFDARDGAAHFQAVRFFLVSLLALGVDLLLLMAFVHAGMPKVPGQALAVACSMPFNFLGNKLWSFR